MRKDLEALGFDGLATAGHIVSLDATRLSVDALEFSALAKSDAKTDLARAALLYQGDLLDGLNLEVESFDPWLQGEQLRFRTMAVSVFDTLARRLSAAGEGSEAIQAAERLVAFDAGRELAQRLLIELLARHRGRAGALAHADDVKQQVRDELGVDLEPDTLALIARIKAMPAEAPAPKPIVKPASVDAAAEFAPVAPIAPAPLADTVAKPPAAPSVKQFTRAPWRMAAAVASLSLVAGLVALLAYALPQMLRDVAPNDAIAAYPPDNGWRSPAAAVPPSAAVSRAVEGRGMSALLVLPFTAVPADSDPTSRMAGLLSNDLINDLSRVPSLRVIARSTSLQYAKEPVDVAAIGTELGVQYVVEGDVRVDGTKVRINIALIDTKTRLHVWTERYERDDTDRPQVQDEMVRALARQLQVSMMEVRGRGPANPTVDSLLGKGWAALNQFAFFRGGHESGQLFEDALALDPKNVSALTGLGAFKSVAVNTGQIKGDRASLLQESETLLKQALQVDPKASLPLYFLGRVAMWRGKPDEALEHFAQTLILNPSYAPAYGALGYVLLHTDRLQEALDNLMYAIRLSPKDHYLGLWSAHVGRIHFELGQFEEAERWLSQAVRLMPNSSMNRAALAAFHFYRDNSAAADAQIVELKKLGSGGTSTSLISRFTDAVQTRRPQAQAPAERIEQGVRVDRSRAIALPFLKRGVCV